MEMRVRITMITRYVSLHRLARREHSHNPLLSHPACYKSEQRRAKSYLGAWGLFLQAETTKGFELEIGDIRRYRNRHSLKIFPPHAPR